MVGRLPPSLWNSVPDSLPGVRGYFGATRRDR